MKNKVYHLSSCSTCAKIIKELKLAEQFELHDIKQNPMTAAELEEMCALAGSYEALFSRRAMLYKEMGLKDKTLSEADIKSLILEHYTFLKRPVIFFNDRIFIGNSPKEVNKLNDLLRR